MDAVAISFVVSCLVAAGIVATRPIHLKYSMDEISVFPQKVHGAPVPRVGGLALAAGVAVGVAFEGGATARFMTLLLIAGAPAFLGGLAEDLTKRVSALNRLLLTFVAATIAYFLLDARIWDLGIPGSETLLASGALSLVLTMVAVGGFSHSLNIIDGLNGLAGMCAVIMLTAIAYVAATVSDVPIAIGAMAVAASVAGFLLWNFPRGTLFLGDGGSYLLGFLIAELAVLLVQRNDQVSPWFALTVLFYPIWETVYSTYRRAVLRKRSPMAADGLHLHTLVYKRLVRRRFRKGYPDNALAAVYLVVLCAFACTAAALFWDNTVALQASAAGIAAWYVVSYRTIVRMRTPRWLALRNAGKSKTLTT